MNPLVTVLIPTYNRRVMLMECIDSVLAQDYSPVEVIVIDDGSTDGTREFLSDRYGSRVVVLAVEHSGLPAICRNVGIGIAKGEYMAFCDSDDVWYPDKLSLQIEGIRRSGANFFCSDADVAGTNRTLLHNYRFRYTDQRRNLRWENFVILSTVVLHRSLLGNFRFATAPALRGYEDYDLWLRLLPDIRIEYLARPLVRYRTGHDSLSGENRRRDTAIQLRMLFSNSAYRKDPLLMAAKFLRYTIHLVRR